MKKEKEKDCSWLIQFKKENRYFLCFRNGLLESSSLGEKQSPLCSPWNGKINFFVSGVGTENSVSCTPLVRFLPPPSKMKSKESYFYSPGKRTDNLPCFFVGNLENYSVPSNCKGKWVILFPTTGANGFILLLHTAERKFVISYFVRLEKFILLFVKLKGIILFSLCTPLSLSLSLQCMGMTG